MIKFHSYEIYIVYSKHWQERVFELGIDIHKADDKFAETVWTKGMSRLEILDDINLDGEKDFAYRQEVFEYENTVRKALEKIYSTEVGQCLLLSLNPKEKIYIIPNPFVKSLPMTEWSKTKNEGNGLRIRVNIDDMLFLDDTLVHELTHAVHYTHDRISKQLMYTGDYGSYEEFLCMQVMNVYRASLGLTRFYKQMTYEMDHSTQTPKPVFAYKEEVYQDFIENGEYIQAFEYSLRNPADLPARLARLQHAKFNPFRDYQELNKKALEFHANLDGTPAKEFMKW